MKHTNIVTLVGVVLGLLLASSAHGRWALRPTNVPVDRLLENTRRHIAAHPKDPQGHYVLGRLHSMAFATAKDQVTIALPFRPDQERKDALPQFLPYASVKVKPSVDGDKLKIDALRLAHLEASIRHYRKAVELAGQHEKPDPAKNEKPENLAKRSDEARAMLGLAWMLEVASQHREAIEAAVDADALGKLEPAQRQSVEDFVKQSSKWREQSLQAYRTAFEATKDADAKNLFAGPGADSLISLDAAKSIVRLVDRGPATAEQQELAAAMKQHIEAIGNVGRVVTPIIFSLRPTNSLDDHLQPDRLVRFDLDGDGVASRWPWLRDDTCLLVWDPRNTGQVKDGRQLFGSVTWWIYWEHGYQPLSALDNNDDGWLSGDELRGLSVWRDRNGNGRSERGEVVTAVSLGVRRIATRPNSHSGKAPAHTAGIELDDGRTAATYDWTPLSVPD